MTPEVQGIIAYGIADLVLWGLMIAFGYSCWREGRHKETRR
jgi:hypothetical protein